MGKWGARDHTAHEANGTHHPPSSSSREIGHHQKLLSASLLDRIIPGFHFPASALGECIICFDLAPFLFVLPFFFPSKLWTQIKTKLSIANPQIGHSASVLDYFLVMGPSPLQLYCPPHLAGLFPIYTEGEQRNGWMQVKADVYGEFPGHSISIC